MAAHPFPRGALIIASSPRHPFRRLTVAALTGLLLAGLSATVPPPAAAEGGSGLVSMVNGYRASQGLRAVRNHATIEEIAVDRAREMAAAGEIGHDFDALIERFAREGVCWRGFGEIVARNRDGGFASFGEQWWGSSLHKAQMLGDYTHASGARVFDGERWYGVMIFVKLCGTDPSGFSDIATSKFYADIVWLVEAEITHGCTATRFCPDAVVTRGQMASFITRASNLGSASRDYFRDDETNKHEANINRLAQADITSGCDDDRFCPNGSVTRGQMASFLVRALNLPPTSRDYYTDDNASKHEDSINRLAASGITAGCGGSHFCPNGYVTRGQMAAFLHRGFD